MPSISSTAPFLFNIFIFMVSSYLQWPLHTINGLLKNLNINTLLYQYSLISILSYINTLLYQYSLISILLYQYSYINTLLYQYSLISILSYINTFLFSSLSSYLRLSFLPLYQYSFSFSSSFPVPFVPRIFVYKIIKIQRDLRQPLCSTPSPHTASSAA